MKGGLYIPPNLRLDERGEGRSAVASMKGGLYIPPNAWLAASERRLHVASMKGGLYIPPNLNSGDIADRRSVLLQ